MDSVGPWVVAKTPNLCVLFLVLRLTSESQGLDPGDFARKWKRRGLTSFVVGPSPRHTSGLDLDVSRFGYYMCARWAYMLWWVSLPEHVSLVHVDTGTMSHVTARLTGTHYVRQLFGRSSKYLSMNSRHV